MQQYFSASYGEARARFRAAVARLGAPLVSYTEPGATPEGAPLTTDTAWFGPRDAEAVMVLTSATHGVEGFCGSAGQLDFLMNGRPAGLPDGVAALIVHALNPFGFAWLRRVTQEGVDLNRNGGDFTALPGNPVYAAHSALFRPLRPGSDAEAERRAALEDLRRQLGDTAFAVARLSGQHVDAQGIHFGGFEPTWSRRTLERIIAENRLAERAQIGVVDYHTGLGPFGYGEPICGSTPSEPGSARGRRWYGDSMTEPMRGTSTSVVIPGLTQYIWRREVGAERLTFVALEYGTFARTVIEPAVDAEHWLRNGGEADTGADEAETITREMKRVYFPDTPSWNRMMIDRSRQVIEETLTGLAAEIA